jgi:hypothetical protein
MASNSVLHGDVVPGQAGQYKRQKARERSEGQESMPSVVRRTPPRLVVHVVVDATTGKKSGIDLTGGIFECRRLSRELFSQLIKLGVD